MGKNKKDKYKKMLHFQLINTIIKTNKKELQPNKINNTGKILKDDTTIELENFIDNKYNLQTSKVLILALEKLTEKMPCKAKIEEIEKNRVIEITLDEYMERCNITSRTQARKQLNEAIKTLTYDLKLSWYDEKQKFFYNRCSIFKEVINMNSPIVNSRAVIQFDYDFSKGLSYGYIMPVNEKILSLDIRRYPSALPLAIKILQHKSMNKGKMNEDIISTKTLLKATSEIPKYESLTSKSGLSRKIITPLINALEELVDSQIIDEYFFTERLGKQIDIKALERLNYNNFIDWTVHFKISDFPNYKRSRKKSRIKNKKEEGEKKQSIQQKKHLTKSIIKHSFKGSR